MSGLSWTEVALRDKRRHIRRLEEREAFYQAQRMIPIVPMGVERGPIRTKCGMVVVRRRAA